MGDTCNLCSWGFYKNNSGSHAALFDNCTECSPGWTTLNLGSISNDNCSVRKCFILIATISLASSHRQHCIDTDAQCKLALRHLLRATGQFVQYKSTVSSPNLFRPRFLKMNNSQHNFFLTTKFERKFDLLSDMQVV